MHFLSIMFFAISSSSDNFIIGLSYAAKKIKINFINNLVIASISCLGTILAMLFGNIFLVFVKPIYTNILGSFILVLFGLYMLRNAFKKNQCDCDCVQNCENHVNIYNEMLEHPEIVDKNNSKTIDFKEAIILGFILSINNIGLGIGASLLGMNIYLTSLTSLVFSIFFIRMGYFIGEKVFSSKLANCAEKISACVIILLGILEVLIRR